ncbi:uncharacterized protein [Nicotiana tomentosiformis]|uniref:uncharacterized protein n=1 Tax=Nicotiana tomentosiformis TaxID=4098 RepID=UPI00388CCD15
MTTKFLENYFYAAKTGQMRKEIHNFSQGEGNTVFEAWERFKKLLRRYPRNKIEQWMQLQDFWDGLNPSSRRLLNSAVAGPMMKKTPEEIITLLNELSEDVEQWSTDQGNRRRSMGVHQVESLVAMQAQIAAMATGIKQLTIAQKDKWDKLQICYLRGLLGLFPSDTEKNPKETIKVVSLRSGKTLADPVVKARPEVVSKQTETPVEKKSEEKKGQNSGVQKEIEESRHMAALPFPQNMRREKLDKYFRRFLEMLKQLYVNIPFTEVLTQMPAYAKFLKEILSSKRKLEETTLVKLNAHCSAILQNKIPPKCGGPRKLHHTMLVGSENFDKALCDSGASINLMPLSVFRKLEDELGVIKLIPVSLQLAEQTTILPEGIIEYILVRVDTYLFPVDFIVVDMEVNKEVPLVLGRPFLCTGRAILDICEGQLMLRVGNKKVVFQMKRMMKYPSDKVSAYSCFKLDVVRELAEKYKIVEDEDPEIKKEAEALETEDQVLDEEELKEEASKPNVKLKVLPTHLKYAFLETNNFPMIISADLTCYNQIPIAPKDVEKTTFTCPSEVFMDDFTLFGDEFEDFLMNLKLVLKHCKSTHLVLNWEKCHFMVKEGIFLCHKLTTHGLKVDRAKVDVKSRLPPPTFVRSIRSFLGHAGFYRRFIKTFSSITKPLTALLAKDVKFVFNMECLRAFELIKEKLVSAPIMVTPDWSQPFEIICDASDVVVGAVLGQRKDKMFRPIYYASRSKVIVHTDHSALKYLLSKKKSKPCLMWWVLLLQEFYLEIKDKKGTENQVVDHLSRLEKPPIETVEIREEFPDEKIFSIDVVSERPPWYADVANYLASGWLPHDLTCDQRRKLQDGVIQRCVPEGEMASVMSHCHDEAAGGHYGGNCTTAKVMEASFFWPTLYKDARAYVAACDKCQRASNISKRDEMHLNSILVEEIPTRTNDARVVCEFLQKNIFTRFGTPRVIISENGSHFMNKQFVALMSKYGVTHKTGTPYHAQTSGQVEVANQELKRILEKMVSASHKDWSVKLDEALWAYRTAFKTTIRTLPFKLVYVKSCHLLVEIEHKAYWSIKMLNLDLSLVGEHRLAQMNKLDEFRLDAYENARIFKEKTKRWHDHMITPKEFHEGDRVLLYNSRLKLFPGKFQSRWTSPYVVKHVSPYVAVEILDEEGNEIFNVNGHRRKVCANLEDFVPLLHCGGVVLIVGWLIGTMSSEVASSSRRGGRWAPPPAPMEEEEERIDPDADMFVPAVNPEPKVAIDDRKLARKYNEIYNNIRALGFDCLFRPGDAVNMNLVKEFYSNWQPEASLDAVYEVWDVNEFHKDMKKGTFHCLAKVILRLINAKIMPTQSESDVLRLKVYLIYAFLTRMRFDIRKIMLEHMVRVRTLGACRLFYPSMISQLLQAHHIEEEFHYDRTIPVTYPIKAFDITVVIDPPPAAAAVTSDQRLVRVGETLQLLFADLSLRFARGETDFA